MNSSSAKTILEEMKNYDFFRSFPPELLEPLASFARIKDYQPQQLILEQGQNNDTLYFLRDGRVAIQVDGENVSELSRQGEIFGEMSLINRRPVGANVRALSHVSMLQLSEGQLQIYADNEREKIQHLLHRVYASVLADRLTATNEKAKKFEIANRDLAVAHESLRKLNSELEAEIARRSAELVLKVKDLTQSHLRPAQAMLATWTQQKDENQIVSTIAQIPQNVVFELFRNISEVVDFLKPVADLAEKGISKGRRRVLLFDTNRKQQQIARLALGGTGVELSLSSTLEEFENSLQSEDFDLLICESEDSRPLQRAAELKPSIPVVVLMNSNLELYLKTIEEFKSRHFFISRNLDNRLFTIKNIAVTVSKILNRDFFGLEKYLAWGAKVVEKQVTRSDQRSELIEEMNEHFRNIGLRPTILDRVQSAIEEMLMNAIYDAPVDMKGAPLFNHLDRSQKINLSPEHSAKFRYGTDGVLLAVSVTDPFGSLTKEIITNYLSACYSGITETSREGKGGAGKGLYMIVESSDLTVFNVQKAQKTEVICLFNLDRSLEEKSQPSFHLFFT